MNLYGFHYCALGCRSKGVYGGRCSLKCPQNCQEGNCDIVNGFCLGCVPGYRGHRCEIG